MKLHKINLENESKRIYTKPYRTSIKQKKIIETTVKEMLNDGVIQNSNSDFCSPAVLALKKDGSYRFCVDYRQLNKITIKD